MSLNRTFAVLLAALAVTACEKNAVRDLTAPVPTARIKFFNYGVNAPAVHFYAGDTKLTATTTASCSAAKNPPVTANDSLCLTTGVQSTLGVAYGSSASGGLYTGVEPGQYTFAGRLAADQATVISSVSTTIESGKAYSYYQGGIYNATTKTVDGFLVEDNFSSTIDWTVAEVRLVNAIGNSQSMTLSLINTETSQEVPIGTAVAYRTASPFVRIAPGAYNLRVRFAGSTSDQVILANMAFEPGRVYTLAARGDMTVTSATATNRPTIEQTVNR